MAHLKLSVLLIVACLVMACDPMAPDPKSLVVVVTPTIAPTAVALALAQPTVVPATVAPPTVSGLATLAATSANADVAMASEAAMSASTGSAAVDVPTQEGSTAEAVAQAITTQAADVPTDTAQGISTQAALAQSTAAPAGSPSATPGGCTDTQGQVIDLTFASKILQNEAERYRVYLPPCYSASGRRYPYVILLHGSDGNETEWTTQLKVNEVLDAGLSNHSLAPMILIMPNGGDLANLNQFQAVSFENLIVNEMVPEIEQNFCTWNAREGRDIGGVSRGGFWAFEIAFRHPDLFGAIGGHSAFFDPDNAPPAANPLGLAKTVQFAPGMQPRIWLDAGKDDYARPNLEVFKKALDARNIDAEYTMNPIGKHEVAYWATHVSEYLSFYGRTWPHTVEDLPSCLQ